MTNNKVYLVFEEWHFPIGDSGTDFHIFADYEKAKEFFNDEYINIEDIRNSFKDCDYVENNNTRDVYEIYEEGYYSSNSYYMEIKEMEVTK